MREIVFIQRHEDRWREIEGYVRRMRSVDPDVLARSYVSVIDDLAHARAQYPTSLTTAYLNGLAAQMHVALARNRRAHLRSASHFWLRSAPEALVQIRSYIMLCTAAILMMAAMGFLVGLESLDLARVILGNGYVDMTLANIEMGQPMNVYASMPPVAMFLRIALNNVWVMTSITAFGIIPVIGIMQSIVVHGLMIGTFHAVFATHGHLGTSILAILVHGAFELTCLVVSAAAGLRMGLSFLNPGTYPRQVAFIRAARGAVSTIIVLVPFIVVAAFLEGFITRWTTMPLALNLFIIIASFVLIWGYVFFLPHRFVTRGAPHEQRPDRSTSRSS